MTIFEILKSDHKKVGALLKQIEKTTQAQTTKREVLFSKFQQDFSLHAKSEEKAVYTPLKLKEKTHGIVMESYEEHDLVEHLINQLSEISPSEDTWTAKMALVTNLIISHVKEEESVLFKKMKSICKPKELVQMALDFKSIKKEKTNYTVNKKMKMNHEGMWAP